MDRSDLGAIDDDSLQAFYALDRERDRLTSGIGLLEFVRTIEVIERTLPAAPATVADIGGGPGIYTGLLLERGYSVVHRDVVADHVRQVRDRHPLGTDAGDRLDAAVGDARDLDLGDDRVDAVLLLGPLYHLADRDDRLAAIREAARISREGAPIYAAAISRHAVLIDSIMMKRVDVEHPGVLDLLDVVRDTGEIPPLFEGSFNGYAHRLEQLRDELQTAGLRVDDLVSVEGIAFTVADLDDRLSDPAELERLLSVLRATESEPDIAGIGPHLLATAVAEASP